MNSDRRICYFCQSEDSEMLYPVKDIFDDEYFLQKCRNCNAVFLSPNPTEEQLARAYDSSYYGTKEEKFSSPGIEKVLDKFRMGRAKRLHKALKGQGNVLDIGCGNGRFLKYLSSLGNYRIYGTELDGNSAKRAQSIENLTLKVGVLEEDDFPEHSFDAITLFHVFEHLTDPSSMLAIIAKILKPDGILVMSFPNIASNQSLWFKGDWLHLDPPRHLFYFSPEDFETIMKKEGFVIEKKHFRSMEQNPFGMTQSILNKIIVKRDVLFESMKGNHSYVEEYVGFSLFMQKLFFLCTFPLFAIADLFAGNKGASVEFILRKQK